MRGWLVGGLAVAATLAAAACGGSDGDAVVVPGPQDEGGVPDALAPDADAADADVPDAPLPDGAINCGLTPLACPPPSVCGDGRAGPGESCDDGNTDPGDGCSATCRVEAPYWICAFGIACVDTRNCAAITDAGGGDGGCIIPPKIPVCGDGVLDHAEACDDGNNLGADGCESDCKAIEANYACPTAGAPCVSTMTCGDGVLQGVEHCDDGNAKNDDGCSSTCKLEMGWACPLPGTACNATKCGDGIVAGAEECDDKNNDPNDGCSPTCRLQTTVLSVAPTTTTQGKTTIINWACPAPGKACVKTTCGNGIREGTEQCDDANNKALDGCSADCQLEPSCPNGKCVAKCGDGLLFDFDADGDGKKDEECDDGNTRNGDGCSATCLVEAGFTCDTVVAPSPPYLDLPVVLRDFKYWDAADTESHPDFERYACAVASKGLTLSTLGVAPRVPLYAKSDGDPSCTSASQLTSALDFTDWYADILIGGKQRSKRIDGTMLRLSLQVDGSYVFDSDVDQPYMTLGGFFPLEGKGWGDQGAAHNFAFTTELRYWFTYDATTSPELKFSGDDDVWLFVNNQLALDLGGLHGRLDDSFVLDPVKAAALGLENGKLYEVALFHAERHTQASNFKLTLRDYIKKVSVCKEACGDGTRTGSEQCDNGLANTDSGAYGSCRLDCTLGPYCGDKTTTTPNEQCDDGTNLTPYSPKASAACGPSCRAPAFCGDGFVQGAFGEHCDNGTASNNGAYGSCKSDCTLGPRCGDGLVQASAGEACDNGFNLTSYLRHPSAYDCAPDCTKPRFCGDGVVDVPFEQCDKGAANTDVGPPTSCTKECVFHGN